MKNIVHIQDHEAKVSIEDISKFSGISTRAIIKAIRTSSKEFKEFGLSLGSDVTLKGTILNEASATFLLTLLNNTAQVVKFKFDLVMQFYKMRELICETNKKQLEIKESHIKKLSSSIYSKPRSGDYQLPDRIRQDYNIQCSTAFINQMLEDEGIIKNEPIMVNHFTNTDDTRAVSSGNSILVHTRSLLSMIDERNITRGVGYEDSNPTLF